MAPLSLLFIAATLAWAGLSLYVSLRQSRFVAAHRAQVPQAFAATVTAAEHARAADYTLARESVSRVELAVDVALAAVWAFGGIGLLYGALGFLHAPLLRGVAFLIATGVVGSLVGLPFALYRTFVLEGRFGFNKTDARTFLLDRAKGAVIALVVAVPLLTALLVLMRSLTGLWWLWAWFGLLALMIAAPSVFMRFIAPRFNTFAPLADGDLRQRIERLLNGAGYTSSGLFTMDASKRTAHGNAFFIGFGRSKRIVMFDTLLERCAPAEVEPVVAPELGHHPHRHVLTGLARGALTSLVGLALFGWLARQPWLLPDFAVHGADGSEAVALYVCLLLSAIVSPLGGLAGNWISRRNEYQADAYAGRTVGVAPMVSALTNLARDNASTLTPDPLYSLVHHSHPTVPLRVARLHGLQPA